ncbi:MAG: Rrf2 family transcriptional regulator [Bacteroidota bacterium]|nr:Rrf2 family transcriptional regulator [Bacteroidota bacterium]
MLSITSKYGIRATVYIAGKSKKGEKIGIKKISEDLDLPMPFLAKILQQLVKKKILVSSKGPHGGFCIAREPKDIYLIEVVKAIDGEDVFHRCVLYNENCASFEKNRTPCILHVDYVKARDKIEKLFKTKTVQNLVNVARKSG